MFILLMAGTVRLEELAADLYALQRLGEEEFLVAYDEIPDEGSGSLYIRIVNWIQYTDPENVAKVHQFLVWTETRYPA